MGAVGAHVGYQAHAALAGQLDAFVELLRDAHGPRGTEVQADGGSLLESGRCERRRRFRLAVALRDVGYRELRARLAEVGDDIDEIGGRAATVGVFDPIDRIDGHAQRLDNLQDGLGVVGFELFAFPADKLGGKGAKPGQEVLPGFLGWRAPLFVPLGAEFPPSFGDLGRRLHPGREGSPDPPVLLGIERLDVPLPLDDQAHRHRLHPAGRQATRHLLPQQRRHLVSDEAVQNPPGLLRFHLVHVQPVSVGERFADGGGGDLVENDPPKLALGDSQRLGEVPRDGLALPVQVGGQEDEGRGLGVLAQCGEGPFPGGERLISGLEMVLDVHSQPPLGKVADMADGGQHDVIVAKVSIYGFRLGGRLDDDEVLAQPARNGPVGVAPGSPASFSGFSGSFGHCRCRSTLSAAPDYTSTYIPELPVVGLSIAGSAT